MRQRPAPVLPARLAALLAALAAACANAATAPAGGGPELEARGGTWQGDTLRLPFGATAAVAGGASVTFAARGDDSRCPVDAVCAWEGDASLTVRVAGAGRAAESRVLHTSRRFAAETVTAGATRLRPFGVLPALRAAGPRPADADVVALFVATRP